MDAAILSHAGRGVASPDGPVRRRLARSGSLDFGSLSIPLDDLNRPSSSQAPIMRTRKPIRWLLWGLLSVCLVWAVVGGGAFAWLFVSSVVGDGDLLSSGIDCSDAMYEAEGIPPDHMTDEDCEEETWNDEGVSGTWRMPRAEVAGWLKESYPGHRATRCGRRSICLDLDFPLDNGENLVDLTVLYEDRHTALVKLDASSGSAS
jgi:hypothetical protein